MTTDSTKCTNSPIQEFVQSLSGVSGEGSDTFENSKGIGMLQTKKLGLADYLI